MRGDLSSMRRASGPRETHLSFVFRGGGLARGPRPVCWAAQPGSGPNQSSCFSFGNLFPGLQVCILAIQAAAAHQAALEPLHDESGPRRGRHRQPETPPALETATLQPLLGAHPWKRILD